MISVQRLILLTLCTFLISSNSIAQVQEVITIPIIHQSPIIDGDPGEWKNDAFSDGSWTLDRVQQASWYHPKRNRLVVDDGEVKGDLDLEAIYYMGYNGRYLFLAAMVKDNIHDVTESNHEPKRWYYKDAIAWFFEFPRDTISEKFGAGDHAFAFVIDEGMPDYGAWWRHGSADSTYIEEPLPKAAVDYAIQFNPWHRNAADYMFEAKVDLSQILNEEEYTALQEGHSMSMMIVHCDPDGGEYGGHLLIYGKGDDDSTWSEMKFEKGE